MDTQPEKVTLEDLATKLEEVVAVVNRMETDMSYDRSRIDDVIMRLETMESKQKILLERVPRIENKLKDAVSDAVRDVVNPVCTKMGELSENIKGKKVVVREIKQKSLWSKLWGR